MSDKEKVVNAIVQDFKKKYKRNPKDSKELASFVQAEGGKKYTDKKTKEVLGNSQQKPEEQKQEDEKQTKMALHGAKLQYFKSLKHQCAEDEEVVYYKKGGAVECGCKKKGGEVKPEKDCGGGAVGKFKAIRKGRTGFDVTAYADATGSQGGFRNAQKKKKKKGTTWGETTEFIPGVKGTQKPSQSSETKEDKIYNSGEETVWESQLEKKKVNKKSCGGEVVKNFKAKCGSKIKKHQKGTEKGGIEYKPNWYKSTSRRNIRVSNNGLPSDELSKISINGDEFTRNIYPAIINDGEVKYDTFYTYKPKNHPAEVGSSINPSQKYRNLKEAFNRIASIPTYYYSQYGK